MRAGLVIAAATVLLAACAGSPTQKRWSCAPSKGVFRTCASIGEIDARSTPQSMAGAAGVTLHTLTGGALANPARAANPEGQPEREGDTVLRIVVAPWTDSAGDYHAVSDIYAVVRRGGWTVPVPPPPPPPAGLTAAGAQP